VSDAVEAVFLKALAVAPSARFADMGAFWEALNKAANQTAGPTLLRQPFAAPVAAEPTVQPFEPQRLATPAQLSAQPPMPPAAPSSPMSVGLGGQPSAPFCPQTPYPVFQQTPYLAPSVALSSAHAADGGSRVLLWVFLVAAALLVLAIAGSFFMCVCIAAANR